MAPPRGGGGVPMMMMMGAGRAPSQQQQSPTVSAGVPPAEPRTPRETAGPSANSSLVLAQQPPPLQQVIPADNVVEPQGTKTPPTAETTQLPDTPPASVPPVQESPSAIVSAHAPAAAAAPAQQSAQQVAPQPPPLQVVSVVPTAAATPAPSPVKAATAAAPSSIAVPPQQPPPSPQAADDHQSPSHGTELIRPSDSSDSDIHFEEEEIHSIAIAEESDEEEASQKATKPAAVSVKPLSARVEPPPPLVREPSAEFAQGPVRRVDTSEPPQEPPSAASRPPSSSSSPSPSFDKMPSGSIGGSNSAAVPAMRLDSGAPRGANPASSQPAPPTTTVPPAVRQRIINQFLSILCPQQYSGKVVRLHSIRPLPKEPATSSSAVSGGTIFVVSYPAFSNSSFGAASLYFPQVRLMMRDAAPSPTTPGLLETSCVLHEASLGLMGFAESVPDAAAMLLRGACDSCFVTSVSAIMIGTKSSSEEVAVSSPNRGKKNQPSFSERGASVARIATLTVEWRPHSTPTSDTQCPVHGCAMELFDLHRKELLCALCNAKSSGNLPSSRSQRICVLSEIITKSNAHEIEGTFRHRLDELSDLISRNIQQHQRLTFMGAKRREAINHQFDLFIAAVEAKREEFLEASAAEFTSSASSTSKEILVADEQVCMVSAALQHLKALVEPPTTAAGGGPLSQFMRIATVAQALQTVKDAPVSGSRGKGSIPTPYSAASNPRIILPNLEGALSYIQQLPMTAITSPSSPSKQAAGFVVGGGTSPFRSINSPFKDRGDYSPPQRRNSPQKAAAGQTPSKAALQQQVHHLHQQLRTPNRRISSAEEFRQQRRSSPSKKGRGGSDEAALYAVPGKNGTCLFNCPVQGMIHSDCAVQWTLRVDDPGDWVGVGVGVGGSLDQWHSGETFDLSHLWIVLPRTPKTLVLRVTAIANGNAKLSVLDKRGKQLDDGRIAHWNIQRPCFPQVSFGGRNGKVTMVSTPQVVAL
jgi:hypothetical protein